MATDFFSGELEDEEKKNQAVASAPESQVGSQESAILGAQAQPNQPGQGTKSGSFTNLQSYLDANESSKFGKQLAGQVEGEIDGANQLQTTAQDQFKQRADSSAVGLNQGLLDKVNTDPVSVAKDNQSKQDFVKMRDAYYTGPKTFADAQDLYSPTNQAVTKAANAATNIEDSSGRKALLDDYYGSGAGRYDYTSGQKKLDNYLVQVDPNSREYFKDVKGKADETNNNFANLTNTLNQYGQTKAQETEQTRQATRGALGIDDLNNEVGGGAIGMTKQEIEKAYQDAQSRYNDISGRAKNQLTSRDIDAEMASLLGLQEGMDIWGIDPTQYLQTGVAPTRDAAASKEQAAKIAALYELAGKDNTYLDVNQAGTYDPNSAAQFKKDQFLNDIAGKKSLYDEAVNRKVFGMGNRTDGGGKGPSHFQGEARPGSEVSFGGAIYGMSPEQIKQAYGVDGRIDSGFVEGSILDNLGRYDSELAAISDSDTRRGTYSAQRDQFQNLLAALQKKYGYGDKLK